MNCFTPDFHRVIRSAANLPSGFEFAEAETQMPERYLWGVPVDHFAGYTIKNGEFPVGWIEVFAFRSDRQAYIAYSKFWDEREIAKPVVPPPIIGEMTSLYMPELVVNDDPSLALQVVIKQCNCVVDYFIWTEAGADEVFNSAKSLANAIPCP